ncbi:hypothetical protein [Nitrosopumilus sp.]|uniref:hypothetical protein n=1 Tax=Nitrosopumilus sp. TaxID=2024843 RepID=UPI00262CC630|nr:hypothetical protein [Nitrosopumilus sp.]
MKSNYRKLTARCDGREISLPKEYVDFIGMHAEGKEMKNRFGKKSVVAVWLNEYNEMVLANQEIIPLERTNGIVSLDNSITVRSGTYGFVVPWIISQQYPMMGMHPKGFEVNKFEDNRLILTPVE